MATNSGFELNVDFKGLFTRLDQLMVKLAQVDKSLVALQKTFDTFSKGFTKSGPFMDFMRQLAKLPTVDVKSFGAIAKGISNIGNAVSNLPRNMGTKTATLTNSVKALALLLKSLGPVLSANLSVQTGKDLSILLNEVFKAVSLASNMKVSPRTLESMASFFNAIIKLSNNQGAINSAVKSFTKLTVVFKTIAGLSGAIPGGKQLEEVSKSFDRLGRSFRAFVFLEKNFDTKSTVRFITQMVKLVGILRLVTKFAGDAKKLTAVGTALQGIASFFNQLSNVNAKDPQKFKVFEANIKYIASALRQLNNIKFNAKNANAIAAFLNSGALNTQMLGAAKNSFSGFNDSFANLIKIGFGTRLGSVIFDTMTRIFNNSFRAILTGARKFAVDFANIVQNSGRQIMQLGTHIEQIGKRLSQGFGIQSLVSSQGFNMAADFQRTLSLIAATGVPQEALDDYEEFADIIGIKYPLSANEALEAILDLTKAGLAFADVQNVLPSAADLAALTDSQDVVATTNTLIVATNAFKNFSAETEGTFTNVAEAADLLIAAADSSTATVESLSAALTDAAASANTAGEGLDEFLAAAAILDQFGIKADRGGTALRSLYNAISRPQARAEFQRLGVAFENADGTLRSLNSIIQDLNDAYERLGLTQADQVKSMRIIADTYAFQAFSVLRTTDGIDDMIEMMQGVPSAADRAATSLDNFRGDLLQMQGSFETLQKEFFIPLLDRFFRPFIRGLKGIIDAFIALPEPILEIVSTTTLLLSALATLTGSGLVLVGIMTKIGGSIIFATGAMFRMILQLPLLVANIGAVVASLSTFFAVAGAFIVVVGTIAAVVVSAQRAIEQNIGGAGAAWNELLDTVRAVANGISAVVTQVVNVFRRVFGVLGDPSNQQSVSLFTSLFNRLNEAFEGILEKVNVASRALGAFHTFLSGTATKSSFREYRRQLNELAESPLIQQLFGTEQTQVAIDRFFREITRALVNIKTAFTNISGGIYELLFGSGDSSQLKRGISDLLADIAQAIQGITGINLASVIFSLRDGDLMEAAQQMVARLMRGIHRFVLRQEEFVTRIGTLIFNYLFNPFKQIEFGARLFGLDNLANFIKPFSDFVTTAFQDIVGTIFDIFRGESLVDAIAQNFEGVSTPILQTIEDIQNAVDSIFGFINTKILPMIDILVTEFKRIGEEAGPAITGFIDHLVSNVLPPLRDFVMREVLPIWYALEETMTNIWTIIQPGVEGFVSFIVNEAFPSIVNFGEGTLIPSLVSIAAFIRDTFLSFLPVIEGAVQFIVQTAIPAIVTFIQTHVIPPLTTVITIVRNFLDVLRPVFTTIVNFFTGVIVPAIEAVAGVVGVAIYAVIYSISNLWAQARPYLDLFGRGINIAFNGVRAIILIALEVVNNFIDIVAIIWNLVRAGVEALGRGIEDVWNAISDIIQPVIDLVNDFTDSMKDIYGEVEHPITELGQLVENVFGGIFQWFVDIISKIGDFIGSVRRAVEELTEFEQASTRSAELLETFQDSLFEQEPEFLRVLAHRFQGDDFFEFVNQLTDSMRRFEDINGVAITGVEQLEETYENLYGSTFDEIQRKLAQYLVAHNLGLTGVELTAAQGTEALRQLAEGSADSAAQAYALSIEGVAEQVERIYLEALGLVGDLGERAAEQFEDGIRGNAGKSIFDDLFGNVDPADLPDVPANVNVDYTGLGEEGQAAVDEMTAAMEEVAQVQARIAKLNEDYSIQEERKNEDDILEEQKKRDDIVKLEQEQDDKLREMQSKFNLETLRNNEDLQRDLEEIQTDASEAVLDAVIGRDSAAAQSAIKAANRETKERLEEFKIEEKRRAEDFKLEEEAHKKEKDERIRAAKEALQELITKNNTERRRRLEDYQRDLRDLNLALDEEKAKLQAHYDTTSSMQDAALAEQEAVLMTMLGNWGQFAEEVASGLLDIMNIDFNSVIGRGGTGGTGGTGGGGGTTGGAVSQASTAIQNIVSAAGGVTSALAGSGSLAQKKSQAQFAFQYLSNAVNSLKQVMSSSSFASIRTAADEALKKIGAAVEYGQKVTNNADSTQGLQAGVSSAIRQVLEQLNALSSVLQYVPAQASNLNGGQSNNTRMPVLADGGKILRSGVAMVHKDEVIGKPSALARAGYLGNLSVNSVVNVSVSGANMDVDTLAATIERKVVSGVSASVAKVIQGRNS